MNIKSHFFTAVEFCFFAQVTLCEAWNPSATFRKIRGMDQVLPKMDNKALTEMDNEDLTEMDNEALPEMDNEDLTEMDNEDLTEYLPNDCANFAGADGLCDQ